MRVADIERSARAGADRQGDGDHVILQGGYGPDQDQEEANTVCDRIAVMNHGIIQQVGTPKELYERPANLFVANFLGTANILEGGIDGASRMFAAAGGLRLPISPDQTVVAGARAVFRPQDAAIVEAGRPAQPDAATVSGTVSWREFLGASVRYGLQAAGTEIVVDCPFRAGDVLHENGTAVTVAIPHRSVRWLRD